MPQDPTILIANSITKISPERTWLLRHKFRPIERSNIYVITFIVYLKKIKYNIYFQIFAAIATYMLIFIQFMPSDDVFYEGVTNPMANVTHI